MEATLSLPHYVMAGLVPAIHVLLSAAAKTWMPGTRPGMTKSDVRSCVNYGLKIAAPVVALLSNSMCAFAASFSA